MPIAARWHWQVPLQQRGPTASLSGQKQRPGGRRVRVSPLPTGRGQGPAPPGRPTAATHTGTYPGSQADTALPQKPEDGPSALHGRNDAQAEHQPCCHWHWTVPDTSRADWIAASALASGCSRGHANGSQPRGVNHTSENRSPTNGRVQQPRQGPAKATTRMNRG